MRLPVFLGAGAITTGMLLLGGVAATELNPMPVVSVDAMEVDGASIFSTPLPEVSPTPELVVKVSHPLRPGDWHLSMDGRAVTLAAAPVATVLHVALPGPLPMGSKHTVQLTAGAMHVRAGFQVVPPLSAQVSMRLSHLRADAPATIVATVQFSRPVADRVQVQDHVRLTGHPTFIWRDARTLELVSSGFALSDYAALTVDAGIKGADGTWSRDGAKAELTVPSTLTRVLPGRMVQMYYVNTDEGRAAFFAHARQIDVLSPGWYDACLLYTSPSPRDRQKSRMPSSA